MFFDQWPNLSGLVSEKLSDVSIAETPQEGAPDFQPWTVVIDFPDDACESDEALQQRALDAIPGAIDDLALLVRMEADDKGPVYVKTASPRHPAGVVSRVYRGRFPVTLTTHYNPNEAKTQVALTILGASAVPVVARNVVNGDTDKPAETQAPIPAKPPCSTAGKACSKPPKSKPAETPAPATEEVEDPLS